MESDGPAITGQEIAPGAISACRAKVGLRGARGSETDFRDAQTIDFRLELTLCWTANVTRPCPGHCH